MSLRYFSSLFPFYFNTCWRVLLFVFLPMQNSSIFPLSYTFPSFSPVSILPIFSFLFPSFFSLVCLDYWCFSIRYSFFTFSILFTFLSSFSSYSPHNFPFFLYRFPFFSSLPFLLPLLTRLRATISKKSTILFPPSFVLFSFFFIMPPILPSLLSHLPYFTFLRLCPSFLPLFPFLSFSSVPERWINHHASARNNQWRSD